MKDYDSIYPAIEDLRKAARRRLPKFAFEFLDSATGKELGKFRNQDALNDILFQPDILTGDLSPSLETEFLGKSYAAPFGIAPLGFSGVIWPKAEHLLANHAATANIPYCFSTIATEVPEILGPLSQSNGWFQLYTPPDPTIEDDMLNRVAESGIDTLVVTLDVPADSRRERQRRALITLPFRLTPSVIWQLLTHPIWSLAFAFSGVPRMKFMEPYEKMAAGGGSKFVHIGRRLRTNPSPQHFKRIRKVWKGKLIAKGVMDPIRAKQLVELGADAIWVSNHGARQFEASPAAITELPKIKKAVPNTPIIFDSGVSSGLDVMRALALGADFVMLGRAWHYGLGALGAKGPAQVHHILREDMTANMAQIGVEKLNKIQTRLLR